HLIHSFSAYVILFWTKYFNQPIEWYLSDSELTIDGERCAGSPTGSHRHRECMVTSDRKRLSVSDGLVFHWRDLDTDDMPSHRLRHQLWTLYNLEAPTLTYQYAGANLCDSDIAFNLTSSYRTDSDLWVPYGRLTRRNHRISGGTRRQRLLLPVLSSDGVDLDGKSKEIAWFVSNCETSAKRELYVQQLSRYISVDIYGKCGQWVCEPHRSPHCFARIASEYKFYLSFENSICRDYVTEKLFDPLNYAMVPVVFGGADYGRLMPSKSYIDATRLTPKQLADQLLQIGSNRSEYLSYFDWKRDFAVESALDLKFEVLCRLCRALNTRKPYHHSSHTGAEVTKWWFQSSDCKSWVNESHSNANSFVNAL
ncbi:unnamed protein product, partial [Oppiella nova]